MAIQMRRGAWSQFDPTKMLPGEWAVILSGHPDTSNGQALYHCFAAGSVKQIATIEDAATIIANATEDIRDELTQDIASALAQVGAATNAANAAASSASTAANNANAATTATNSATQRAEAAIVAMGDISELAVPEMSADVRGGAKLEQHGGLALRDGALGIGSLVQQSDGYARGGLAEVTAKGHAEQVATTGKNLLDLSEYPTFTNNNTVIVEYLNATEVYVHGSSSSTTWGASNYLVKQSWMKTIPAGTYTLSIDDNTIRVGVESLTSVSGEKATVLAVGASGRSFTIGEEKTVLVGFTIPAGTYDMVIRVQLELGSTATEFEPYTGGAPSPSPDYPQEIQVVRGRNLIPNTATSLTINGVTFTVNADGSVTANGTATSTANLTLATNVIFEAGTYTISGSPRASSADDWNIRCEDTSEPKTRRIYDNGYTSGNSPTGTIPANTPQDIIIRIYSGKTLSNFTFYPQIVKGSTPQPYVPYGHVGMEVQGKNLLDMSDVLNSSSHYVLNADGTLTVKASDNRTWPNIMAMPLDAGTYTLSFTDAVGSIDLRTSDSSYATAITFNTNTTRAKTFTLAANGGIKLKVGYANATYPTTVGVQLELGVEATEYEPYHHTTTPIPLPQRGWVACLPDGTADSLRLDGAGKCEWELKDAEVVLDGTESSWSIINTYEEGSSISTSTHPRYVVSIPDMQVAGSSTIESVDSKVLSDRFKAFRNGNLGGYFTPYGTAQKFTGIHRRGNTNSEIVIYKDGESLADFKTWLSTHPVTVLYPLTTPVTEDCGYIDMPDIPSDCTITIPELDALGIRYFVDDTVTQYGREIYARVRSEYADRITALEQAVAELVTS